MITAEQDMLLRQQWNYESLGEYEGSWIAFRYEVENSSPNLEDLLEIYSGEMAEGRAPIFAYVTFNEVFI